MTTHEAAAAMRAEAGSPVDLFDRVLREAIAARGLSLERLHARLRARGFQVSMGTLSNWQRGRCRPERTGSLGTLHALEDILRLPRDGLVALLGPPRPRGRWAGSPDADGFRNVSHIHDRIGSLLRPIERPSTGRLPLRWRSVDECVTVGSDRAERSIRTRIVFEALVDGVDRHIGIYHNFLGVAPDVHRASWCHVERVLADEAVGVCAMELLFDHPLRRGETYTVEYEFGYTAASPLASLYHRWFRSPAHHYLLRVQFAPDAVPASIFQTWQRTINDPRLDVRELRPNSWHGVHLARSTVPPGGHGIRWEWS